MIDTDEWRDQNTGTGWPFEPECLLTSDSGVPFDRNLLADAQLHPLGGTAHSYLAKIVRGELDVRLQFGDDGTDNRCHARIVEPVPVADVRDDLGRPAGILVAGVDLFASLFSLVPGEYVFAQKNTLLCATCYHAVPDNRVTGFRMPDGEILTGDVWFVGKNGIQFQYTPVSRWNNQGQQVTDNEIKIHVVGDPLRRRRDCGPVGRFETPMFLRRLVIRKGAVDRVLLPSISGGIVLATNGALTTETSLRISQEQPEIVFRFAAGDS